MTDRLAATPVTFIVLRYVALELLGRQRGRSLPNNLGAQLFLRSQSQPLIHVAIVFAVHTSVSLLEQEVKRELSHIGLFMSVYGSQHAKGISAEHLFVLSCRNETEH